MNAERHPEHTITVEFIGTDIDEPTGRRNRYVVDCSCGGIGGGGVDSVSHQAVDSIITRHLEQVGLDKN